MNGESRRPVREDQHGTTTGYNYYGCRCRSCKRAKRLQRGEPLAPDDPRHGTPGGYSYHGCRCDPCREANIDTTNKSRRPAYDPGRATIGDLRLYAQGLGLALPHPGPRRDALIKRYNREHLDRPYGEAA